MYKPSLSMSLLLPLLLTGVAEANPGIATSETGWYRGDLHFHTTYSEDAEEQYGDPMERALKIATYFEDPDLVAAFPELDGNGLDFLAITDHRTIEGCSDPAMTSERLTLICGEEFGGTGHAGAWGLTERVAHETSDGRTPNEQIQFAIDQTHEMGGAFSPNHPVDAGDMWFWDVDGYDTIEIWNTYWSLLTPPSSQEDLDHNIGLSEIENPYIRPAVEEQGGGYNRQAIRYWEAHLTVGKNLGVVGGSDRHMLVMPGQPMTYVQADSVSEADLLAGLRAANTFVSRGPAAPQLLLTITDGAGNSHRVGSTLPLDGGPYTLRAEVSRARGGVLRLMTGDVDPSLDTLGAMEGMALSSVWEEITLTQDIQVIERPFNPADPGWIYGLVLDPLNLNELPMAERLLARLFLDDVEAYGLDYVRLTAHLLTLIDVQMLVMPRLCDPAEWNTNLSACVEIDDVFLGTFHLSEPFHRVANVWMEDGEATDYAMGAISSAIMLR